MNNTINALHRWFGFLPLRHGQEQAGVVSSGVKKFRPGGGHHDALEFPDGTCVLLTSLVEGQEATVLQLPAQPKTPAEEAAQKRVASIG